MVWLNINIARLSHVGEEGGNLLFPMISTYLRGTHRKEGGGSSFKGIVQPLKRGGHEWYQLIGLIILYLSAIF
jgi:hypothetical protein